ncbi:MAG TPA: hypothetical protein VNC78_00345 [Actinomycetota bacterium]|nr:hypothetical protein [Actinomycetota bacterium]
MRSRALSLLALSVLAAALVAPATARAQGSDFQIPVWFYWEESTLDTIVIPPEHGQIYNADGILNGGDAGELTLNNSYLDAIESSIAGWETAIQQFGSPALRDKVEINVYVLGQDSIPSSVMFDPEIVVFTDQSKASVLGIAFSTRPCLVNNSKMLVSSFSYEDMWNTNGQEFGHCLGLSHVVNEQPELDVMNGLYPHNIGAKDNPLHCMSNLDVRALEHVFLGGPEVVSIPASEYTTTDC